MQAARLQSSGSVLLVDRDPQLRRWLEADGYTVDVLETADACLAWLARGLPDVVCLGLQLLGTSALEVLGTIRGRHLRVPVVVLSGSHDTPRVALALETGAYDWLARPLEPTKALTTVRNAVEWRSMSERLWQLERSSSAVAKISSRPAPALKMDDVERRALEDALARTSGNVSEAVRLLGIGRSTAYRMMKRYGMR